LIHEYRGISRKDSPNWNGWGFIDTYHKNRDKNELHILDCDMTLQEYVQSYFLKQSIYKIIFNVLIWSVIVTTAFLITKGKL